jgi:quercetin dioxygenase-like cupin family protein
MEPGVSFARIDADAAEQRFQRLRKDLGVSALGVNVLVFAPGERSRIHTHREQEEVYLVWEGRLTLATGPGEERTLERGEFARVAPDAKRQLVNRERERLVLVAIGASGEHAGRDGVAYEDWDGEGRSPAEMPFPPNLPAGELR